jgi:uncharacterized protein
MTVKNLTKSTTLAHTSRVASSILSRAIGLMFSRPSNSAMILKFGSDVPVALHCFFVFYPIDVVLVNSHLKVVDLTTMNPFSKFISKKKAKYVVELPIGTIRKTKTSLGDSIALFEVVELKNKNSRRVMLKQAAPK